MGMGRRGARKLIVIELNFVDGAYVKQQSLAPFIIHLFDKIGHNEKSENKMSQNPIVRILRKCRVALEIKTSYFRYACYARAQMRSYVGRERCSSNRVFRIGDVQT
jgi:hypothetical protein